MTTDIDDGSTWITMEDNRQLQESHKSNKVERTKVIFGIWYNAEYGTHHNYEMWVPADFDDQAVMKKYPIFLEVYAGPEYQKVQGIWRSAWQQAHFPAAYDCITCKMTSL
jgi:hypothetical protein